MLQRMSSQHKISFLEKESSKEIEKQDIKPEKTIEQIAEEQKSKKLYNKDNGLIRSHSISSARTGEITDIGGPVKYIKSESSNTLWDNDKISKVSLKIKGEADVLKKEEKQVNTNNRIAEQKRMDDLTEKLKDVNQPKVSPIGTYEGSNYKTLSQGMSIFDKKDFQRLEEKTAGEKVSEDVQKKNNLKDDSWKGNSLPISSKNIRDRFFDNLLGNKK